MAPESSLAPSPKVAEGIKTAPINLLAYVHMRNIYASTGAGRVARQLTEHLAMRDDINLHVLADAGDHTRILPLVAGPWADYRYHTFAHDTSRQQAQWFAVDRPKAESFWPEAQIVFCTAESYVPAQKAPLVVTVHDAAYFERGAHAADLAFLKQKLKWKFLFHKLSANADMFHTVSQFSADRLAHFFPAIASRLRVIPNAVTPHFFDPVPASGYTFLNQVGLQDRPYILVPGGLHFRKNAELILAASSQLLKDSPDLIIAVVNHSNPAYVERAEALGPNFRILGFVEEDALHALYSAATLVWFPSRYEGFGLPIVEAMACGAPVVASDASSLPEIAGTAALLVDATDPGAHINAIRMLLRDSLACQQLSREGKLRASHFTWSSSAAQLKHCFDSLL